MNDKAIRSALMAMFLDAEEIAVCSYETCTYPGGIFNDRIWRQGDPSGFKVAKRARSVLGLRPFSHRDAKKFGRGDERLAKFRAKDRKP